VGEWVRSPAIPANLPCISDNRRLLNSVNQQEKRTPATRPVGGEASQSGKIAAPLLDWFEQSGRHNLPWQRPRSAYRVWVAEVMLQQTRVESVIPYYNRFMQSYPDVAALASAPLDQLLASWSGLGYYARARNLHRAACLIMDEHGGELPTDLDGLCRLPGIGRSTAGAILAQAYGSRHPILDGNVKRILSRYYRVEGWPGRSAVAKRLWQLATDETPRERVADYTQAIMDLGATICRRRPLCHLCPLSGECAGHLAGDAGLYPAPAPRRQRPLREVDWLLIGDPESGLLLWPRPPTGIWGGLWTPPELVSGAPVDQWVERHLGAKIDRVDRLEPIGHELTHFRLRIHPVRVAITPDCDCVMDTIDALWYKPHMRSELGIPAPLARLLDQLAHPTAPCN
jgi:A/G-specific adenine glycosylase